MQIQVPAQRRPRPVQQVPPAGKYVGTIRSIQEIDGETEIVWDFRAEDRDWAISHVVSDAQFGDILVDIGLAGQTVTEADILGGKAILVVRTRGGRKSAFIEDVRPIE